MPKTTKSGKVRKSELPDTLKRSPAKAQRQFAKTHDSAAEQYGEGERAHRTAYASLSYLRSFPFDKIKIDRSFVRDLEMGQRKDCAAIIQAVAGLGRQMQISTVAEGIETLDQAQTVVAAGCSELQGFYFSKPVPAAEVSGVLADCAVKLKRAN